MLKDFKTYDEFMLEGNMIRNDLFSFNRCLNVLQLKSANINYDAQNGSYTTFLREKVQDIKSNLKEYEQLENEIFKNQKTNLEMIQLILSIVNNEINVENRYSVRIVTVQNSKVQTHAKDNYNLKLVNEAITSSTSYILLVKNNFPEDKVTETFNNEKFAKYEKEGYVVVLDQVSGSMDSQAKLDNYLSQKTIDINSIKGLRTVIVEIIKEKLFNEYKEKQIQNNQKKKSITNK